MRRTLASLAALVLLAAGALADNWPAWRGPDGMGHCAEKDLPVKWGPMENVRWKLPLPDEGNSTPIVWGNRIFLTQAIGKGANSKRQLWCLDRAEGRKVWEVGIVHDAKETTHGTNPYCSASPATDGERVVVSYGSGGMYCYDFDGKEQWKVDLGKLEHIWGNASSPIFYGDLVILWCGPGERQFLLAVNKKTGAEVWRTEEPGGKFGKDNSEWLGSWCTPVIVKVDGQDQMLVSVPNKLKGFDPKNGKELWSCDGLGRLSYTSPVFANGIAVAMSGYGGPALAVKLGGKGDITKDRLWHHTKGNPQRVGSAVIVGEHVYILNESGIVHCFELKTGKNVAERQERLAGTNWGAMTATADGKLYVMNQQGTTYVLTATPKVELLATNALNERSNASVAVSDGELFLRTYKHLWCIGSPKQ